MPKVAHVGEEAWVRPVTCFRLAHKTSPQDSSLSTSRPSHRFHIRRPIFTCIFEPSKDAQPYFSPMIPAILKHKSNTVKCSSLPSTNLLSTSENTVTICPFCPSLTLSSPITI